MPWIPYYKDNDVYIGLGVFWLIFGVAAIIHGAWKHLRPKLLARRIGLTMLAGFISFAFYAGYVLERQAAEMAKQSRSEYNIRQLSIAFVQYASDWHETLPPANRWMDAIDNPKYLSDDDREAIFHNPWSHGLYGYAFNKALGGVTYGQLNDPENTIQIFETDLSQRNAVGSIKDVAKHQVNLDACFADGHMSSINDYLQGNYRWNP